MLMSAESVKAEFDALRAAGASLVKEGGDAKKVHVLSGRLYLSKSNWLLLDVPNALVRGVFDAMSEPGLELPLKDGQLRAHISVARPDEIAQLGGPDKISERGHHYHYSLGPVKEVEPEGWKDISKCYFIEVSSPELEKLRKSYGLSALPHNGAHPFHITSAVKRKKVTQPGAEVTKVGPKEAASNPLMALHALDDVIAIHMARRRRQLALQAPPPPKPPIIEEEEPKTAAAIDELRDAKSKSDRRDYEGKAIVLRTMMKRAPKEWAVDSEDKGIVGVTHVPTKFRLHLPSHHVADLRKGFSSLAKAAGVWDGPPPSVLKLSLRGGDQRVCPRCGKPILHPLYKDKKGWTFCRSCFRKGEGPVTDA